MNERRALREWVRAPLGLFCSLLFQSVWSGTRESMCDYVKNVTNFPAKNARTPHTNQYSKFVVGAMPWYFCCFFFGRFQTIGQASRPYFILAFVFRSLFSSVAIWPSLSTQMAPTRKQRKREFKNKTWIKQSEQKNKQQHQHPTTMLIK